MQKNGLQIFFASVSTQQICKYLRCGGGPGDWGLSALLAPPWKNSFILETKWSDFCLLGVELEAITGGVGATTPDEDVTDRQEDGGEGVEFSCSCTPVPCTPVAPISWGSNLSQ